MQKLDRKKENTGENTRKDQKLKKRKHENNNINVNVM